jgi:hypothetical protein
MQNYGYDAVFFGAFLMCEPVTPSGSRQGVDGQRREG